MTDDVIFKRDRGIGPVMMGEPLTAEDGRVAVAHPFAEIDVEWLEAYTAGDKPPVQVCDTLPSDFIVVGATLQEGV